MKAIASGRLTPPARRPDPIATDPTLDDLSLHLRVLGEPHRLRIVALLRGGERCVCELEDLLGLSQSLVSNHLRVLRQVGLVRARRDARDARWIYYALEPGAVARLRRQLDELLDLSQADPRPAQCDPEGRPSRG